MSKIFELFGYRLDQWSDEAKKNMAKAWCPFMDSECDGGGNRHQSAIDLSANEKLKLYFPGKTIVQAGVCSLQLRVGEQPWIVCPRRLLSLKSEEGSEQYQLVRQKLAKYSELKLGGAYKAWSEVKMKIQGDRTNDSKTFDYTFDYIVAGTARMLLDNASELVGESVRRVQSIAEENGLTLASRDGKLWIEDFPSDPIVIIEVMTSSTSGGNKKKRTQIAMAFEDAVTNGLSHNAPTINYRQVWARMVSQLIVKSQIGSAWGGTTFWLIQNNLANYISATTALNLSDYVAKTASEVNILSFGYGDLAVDEDNGLAALKECIFHAGPISGNYAMDSESGFLDIIKIGTPPDKKYLIRALFLKKASAQFHF